MFSCCPQIFTTFNWGANYEKFREATALLRLTFSNLVNFSDTRFANSEKRVFKNILHQFEPIITCLEYQVRNGDDNRANIEEADSKLRDKGAKAKELLEILNEEFLFTMSDLTNINI